MKLGEKVNIFAIEICHYADWKLIGTGIYLGKEKVYKNGGWRIYSETRQVVKYKNGILYDDAVKFLPLHVKTYSPKLPKQIRDLEIELMRRKI